MKTHTKKNTETHHIHTPTYLHSQFHMEVDFCPYGINLRGHDTPALTTNKDGESEALKKINTGHNYPSKHVKPTKYIAHHT